MTPLLIRHILFPFDFAEQGRQAVPYVSAFAKRFGSRLTIFSVAPPRPLEGEFIEWFPGVAVERIETTGDPALRIADFAHNHDVDLVMMPTHGLGTFRRVLAGSVTSKVLHDVRCPVWTAAHAELQCAPAIPRTVLCAVEATTEGVRLLQHAALFSKAVGAALKVLHVVEPVSDWPSLARERALQDEAKHTAEHAVASMLESAGVRADSRIVIGDVAARAAEAARENNIDLLIVGRGAIAGPFGRVRSHAFGIIEQSPCPVLSV